MGDFNLTKIRTVNPLLYDCIAYFWGTDLRFLFYLDWGDSKDTWRAVLRTSLIKTCTVAQQISKKA